MGTGRVGAYVGASVGHSSLVKHSGAVEKFAVQQAEKLGNAVPEVCPHSRRHWPLKKKTSRSRQTHVVGEGWSVGVLVGVPVGAGGH